MFAAAYVWAKIINYLEEKITPTMVSAWLDDAEVVELNDEFLMICTPDEFRKDMIVRRCTDYVQDALKDMFQSDAKFKVFVKEEYEAYKAQGKNTTNMDFNPQFTFDNFIVGPSNRMAHSASV